jgi:hypothetical protein
VNGPRRFLITLAVTSVLAVLVGTGLRLLFDTTSWSWPTTISVSAGVSLLVFVLVGRRLVLWSRYGPRPKPQQWNEDMLP